MVKRMQHQARHCCSGWQLRLDAGLYELLGLVFAIVVWFNFLCFFACYLAVRVRAAPTKYPLIKRNPAVDK